MAPLPAEVAKSLNTHNLFDLWGSLPPPPTHTHALRGRVLRQGEQLPAPWARPSALSLSPFAVITAHSRGPQSCPVTTPTTKNQTWH